MFGIGGTELLVILVVALVVLGPKSLPKIARSLGKAMGEFRRVSTDFQRTMNLEAAEDEEREKQENSAKTDTESDTAMPPAPATLSASTEKSSKPTRSRQTTKAPGTKTAAKRSGRTKAAKA